MRQLVLFGLFALATCALADVQVPEMVAKPLAQPPTIDGMIDEAEWAGAGRAEGLLDMQTSQPAPERSEFFLGYNDQYIFFAARLHDPSPGTIRATEYRMNTSLSSDDHVILRIDPTGQLDVFSEFGMNANGATSIDIAGGRAIKREWLGEITTKGRITPDGWEVEARIPWRIMQMPAAGKRTMKVNFLRYVTRSQRLSTWAYNGGDRRYFGWWRDVMSPKLPFERSLKLLPYGFAGYDEDEEGLAAVGLDFKTSLTESIEVVGTINPDFRNIEGDILSLDFSYFERLPADNRPFFQEGAEYVGSLLFAPQRIGGFDAGLNVYGKVGNNITFGALNTVDFGNQVNTVASASFQASPQTLMRMGLTSRSGDLGPENDAWFARVQQIMGPLTLNFRTAGSNDEIDGRGEMHDGFFNYFKDGIEVSGGYQMVSPEFRPRLGFLPERDLKGPHLTFGINRPVAHGPIMEWEVEGGGLSLERYDGSFYRDEVFGVLSLTFRDGTDLDLFHQRSKFLGNKDHLTFFSLEKPRGNNYRRWQVDIQDGFLDGRDYRSYAVVLLYRPVRQLQTVLRVQHVEHFETNRLGIFSANYDLGRDTFISGRLVDRDGDLSGYLSFRRSGNRGTEYFVILGDPNSQTFRSSVIVKVVMPFELKL